MRLPRPKSNHPPEICEAILRECGRDPLRLVERLQACGWSLADAAWAAVHWDLPALAAALANERVKRGMKPSTLAEAELAKIKAELHAMATAATTSKKTTAKLPRPSRTPRIVPAAPKHAARPTRQDEEPGA